MVLLVCLVRSAGANEEPAPSGLTLEAAQQLAIVRNWDLLAAKSDVDLAIAQTIMAREFPNPTVSLLSGKINTDSNPNSTPDGNSLWHRSYDTIAAVNQLLEIGGKRRSRQLSAQSGLAGARLRFLDAKRLLDLGVAKAYIAVVQAEANVRILQESAKSLRREAEIAALRLQAGDISLADKSQIEITADRFELEARTAAAASLAARITLENLLGEPKPAGTTLLADGLERLCATAAPGSGSTTNGMARADLLAAEAAVKKAAAEVRLQKALRIPDPTLTVQYEHQPPDQPNTVGLGVSFPLPLWNRNKSGIATARAAEAQAQVALDKTRAQIAADIAIAQAAYQEAASRWKDYRDIVRPKSATIRQTVAYAYEKGGASLLDLLSAERNDNDVRLAAAQSQADIAAAASTLKSALETPHLEARTK